MFCSPKNTPAYIRILVTGLVVAASPASAVGPIETVAPVEVEPTVVAPTPVTQRPDSDLFDAPLGQILRVRLLRKAAPTPVALPVGRVSSDEICLGGKFAECGE